MIKIKFIIPLMFLIFTCSSYASPTLDVKTAILIDFQGFIREGSRPSLSVA